MTQADLRSRDADAPTVALATRAPVRSGPAHARPPQTDQAGWLPTAGTALSLLALAAIAFVVHVTVISTVEHARSQRLAYADLRKDLAAVTAPTGQVGLDGTLLAFGTPMGYLDVPALGLTREVFFEGTTAGVLAKGPGHRRSSVLPGQPGTAVVYGRAWAYGGPFNGLGDVEIGTPITVTTGQGVHTFRVTGVRRKGTPIPAAPDVAAGEGRLTLVSSEGTLPFAPSEVVYVDALRTSPAVPAPASVLSASSLSSAEQAMAGDRSAWSSVFLLAQALALGALALTWAQRRLASGQVWLVGVPVMGVLSVLASEQLLRLLPNLL